MSKLVTWWVVIGEGVFVGHVGTHLHLLQLTTWRVVAQGCAIFSGHSIFHFQLLYFKENAQWPCLGSTTTRNYSFIPLKSIQWFTFDSHYLWRTYGWCYPMLIRLLKLNKLIFFLPEGLSILIDFLWIDSHIQLILFIT